MIITFIIGYVFIAFEHPVKINKTASALLTGVLVWLLYMLGSHEPEGVKESLSHHLSEISEIIFFLLGAMTIVELVDLHEGFNVITDKITTRNTTKLLWIVGIVSFFLSAVLDSLASAILMVTVLRKLIPDKEQRKLFAGIVIIAVNSSAWSPIGPVTTTMLWIGGQISAAYTILNLFLPSLLGLIAALAYFTFSFRKMEIITSSATESIETERPTSSKIMLIAGILSLLAVPIFKQITHLPPYIAMMFSLGLMWVLSEIVNPIKDQGIVNPDEDAVNEDEEKEASFLKIDIDELRKKYTISHALTRIDTTSILFFLGILLAVGSLQTAGILSNLAQVLDEKVGNLTLIATIIGIASSIVDNVPLVAATQGMYSISAYHIDHHLWQLLTYCAATGGSILVIGSAAGVAVMGMENLNFMWYMKKITLPAAIAYFVGIGAYLIFCQ